jgi:hypothetical protein
MNPPSKRRTRQHVIADLSVHHVEGFIYRGGHTAERVLHDYGYDLLVFTYDNEGYCEPGLLLVQVKATENLQLSASDIAFRVDVRDYNRWKSERVPVILVLYEAAKDRAYWLHVQDYNQKQRVRESRVGAKSLQLRVPSDQLLDARGIRRWQMLNRKFRLRVVGKP